MAPESEELLIKTEGFLCMSDTEIEDGTEVPFNDGEAGDDEGF